MPEGTDLRGSYSKPPTDDFSLPWCLAIERDPTWRSKVAGSLIVSEDTQNALIGRTLRTDDGVRDIRIYMKVQPQGVTPKQASEALQLVSLGTGVNGLAGVCHGGLIGLLLDEVAGEVAVDVFGNNIATVDLKLVFKAPLVTPKIVLCRARLIKEVTGRSAKIEGVIEDGQGFVYATGSAVYVKSKEKL